MELTPEEREQIYKEERARCEDYEEAWATSRGSRASEVMATHVRILGVMYIIVGIVGVFVAIAGYVGLGEFDRSVESIRNHQLDGGQSAEALGYMRSLISNWFALWLIVTAANIVAGIGLLKYKSWAYPLGLILSCVGLLNVPIGTLLGIYGLWVLLSSGTSELFLRQRLAHNGP